MYSVLNDYRLVITCCLHMNVQYSTQNRNIYFLENVSNWRNSYLSFIFVWDLISGKIFVSTKRKSRVTRNILVMSQSVNSPIIIMESKDVIKYRVYVYNKSFNAAINASITVNINRTNALRNNLNDSNRYIYRSKKSFLFRSRLHFLLQLFISRRF